jgi:hypothetical protein
MNQDETGDGVVTSEASLGFFAEAYRDEITLKAGLIWPQVLSLGGALQREPSSAVLKW